MRPAIVHPYAPAAEWRLAVSRRFKAQSAEETYKNEILPIIRQHGLLLECNWASNSTANSDFWMTRMKLLLELSDIHILVDIDPSPNVMWEFNQAKLTARRQNQWALNLLCGWDTYIFKRLKRAVSLCIRNGFAKNDKDPRTGKVGLVHIAGPKDDTFPERLDAAVSSIKEKRGRGLRAEIDWYAREKVVFPFLSDFTRETLTVMTEMARTICENDNLELAREIGTRFGAKGSEGKKRLQYINEAQLAFRDILSGRAALPPAFFERKRLLSRYVQESMAIMAAHDLAFSRFGGFIAQTLGSGLAIKFRDRRHMPANSEGDHQKASDVVSKKGSPKS